MAVAHTGNSMFTKELTHRLALWRSVLGQINVLANTIMRDVIFTKEIFPEYKAHILASAPVPEAGVSCHGTWEVSTGSLARASTKASTYCFVTAAPTTGASKNWTAVKRANF